MTRYLPSGQKSSALMPPASLQSRVTVRSGGIYMMSFLLPRPLSVQVEFLRGAVANEEEGGSRGWIETRIK